MKTLKSSLDGHIDKVATQWIEIKVSHIMNVYFQLVMFGMFVIVLFNHFLYCICFPLLTNFALLYVLYVAFVYAMLYCLW